MVVNYLSNTSEAEEAVAELKGIGGDAVAIRYIVSSAADVERLFVETSTRFGSVDVAVHNSGIMPLSPIGKNNLDLFDPKSSLTKPARRLPGAGSSGAAAMASGGRIIRLSQAASWQSLSTYGPYCIESRRGGTRACSGK